MIMSGEIPGPLRRDAEWVLSTGVGTEWLGDGFRPRRLAELVTLGVLIPVPGKAGRFTVGEVTL
jgi:hypothetical protein